MSDDRWRKPPPTPTRSMVMDEATRALGRRVIDLRDSEEVLPPSPYAEAPRDRLPWQCEPYRSGQGLRGRDVPLATPPTAEYALAQYKRWHAVWEAMGGGRGTPEEQRAAMDAAGFWGLVYEHRLRARGSSGAQCEGGER